MKGELASIRDALDDVSVIGGGGGRSGVVGGIVEKEEVVQVEVVEGGGDDIISNSSCDETENVGNSSNSNSNSVRGGGGIPIYHVNTNKFPQVGAKNKIHGLPTLVLYYEGRELWRHEGLLDGIEILDGVLGGLKENGYGLSSRYNSSSCGME